VIESELFGHERGAFTGAWERRLGRFELAADGTIFLDEIGDLAPALQAKLLRVLEEREFERVGGMHPCSMRARVLAATNRDLHRAVAEARFRADLFFRLNVFHIRVPPLRERVADVPLLARAALERLRARADVRVPRPGPGFERRLAQYAWPGNVRELMNAVERAAVRYPGAVLGAAAFDAVVREAPWRIEPPSAFGPDGPGSEREAIVAVLASEKGNVTRAARRLGMPRGTLRYRIGKLGLRGARGPV
jgi:transcriptional regulator with GAF, ATPase, and Fis domain